MSQKVRRQIEFNRYISHDGIPSKPNRGAKELGNYDGWQNSPHTSSDGAILTEG